MFVSWLGIEPIDLTLKAFASSLPVVVVHIAFYPCSGKLGWLCTISGIEIQFSIYIAFYL